MPGSWRERLDRGRGSRGSRPRCVLLVDGDRQAVAARLTALVGIRDVVVSAEDWWMPRGEPICRDDRWDTSPADEARLDKDPGFVTPEMQVRLRDWWLADQRNDPKTPTWDLASTCRVGRTPGLLLVEAKAHSKEGFRSKTKARSQENLRSIDEAIGEANIARGGPDRWPLGVVERPILSGGQSVRVVVEGGFARDAGGSGLLGLPGRRRNEGQGKSIPVASGLDADGKGPLWRRCGRSVLGQATGGRRFGTPSGDPGVGATPREGLSLLEMLDGELFGGIVAGMAFLGHNKRSNGLALVKGGTVAKRKRTRDRAREWAEYGWRSERDRVELSSVSHVAHVPQARRILVEGRLRTAPLEGEGRLGGSGLSGLWLSANAWAWGYIYGNVRFSLDWGSVIEGRNVYWVEMVTYPRSKAYRFLVSELGFDGDERVRRYDPRKEKGPLRQIDGKWYRHKDHTSEFIVDDDILLSECTQMDFVDHHPDLCSAHVAECEYRGTLGIEVRGPIFSFVLSRGIHIVDERIAPVEGPSEIDFFVKDLEREMLEGQRVDGPIKRRCDRMALMHLVLALWSRGRLREARRLARLFEDESAFEKTIRATIRDHFGLDSYRLPKMMRKRRRT